jgi:CspA family cold shock protein
MKGRVKAFDQGKGYGFINGADDREYLVYFTSIQSRPEELTADAPVEFEPLDTPKGPQAVEVRRVEPERPDA